MVYSGNQANYAISYDASSQAFTISDRGTGSIDGTDTVTGVETFQFADSTINSQVFQTIFQPLPVAANDSGFNATQKHRDVHADDGLCGTGVLQLYHLQQPGRNRQCFRQSDRQPRLVLNREPVFKLGHAGGAIEFRYVTSQSRRTVHVVGGRHHYRH